MYKEKDKKKIYEQAKNVIEGDDNILFLDDVVAELPISKPTFYSWWPKGSDKYNELLALINTNRVKVKRYIRLKLRISGKAAELLSLYRMICTEDERRAINQNYIDVKANVDSKIEIGFIETDVNPVSDESEVDI